MNIKKLIKKIAIVGIGAVFFLAFLAPMGGYGAVVSAAEPEFTVVTTNAVADTIRPTISNNIVAFRYNLLLGYIDLSNSRVVYTSTYCHNLSPKVSGNFITFIQREDLSGKDLNGDNDFTDYVLVVFDVSTGELINTRSPLSLSFPFSISGDKIVYSIFESGAGIDLNGDNDMKDDVLAYFDIPRQTFINLRRQIVGVPIISNRIIAFSATGLYLSYYDLQTGEIFDTLIRATLGSFSVYDDKIAFTTSEVSLSEDLNGDGDISDYIVRYYDTSGRQVFSTGAEVTNKSVAVPNISSNIIAFVTPEAVVGALGSDLNGDGDKLDNIVRYYDISSGVIINTKAETASTAPVVSRNIIAFVSSEGSIGQSGMDLNGDGDKFDYIVRYYNVSTGTLVNTGAEVSDFEVNVSNNIIAFSTVESAIMGSGIDVNGDGDQNDRIVRYMIIGELPTFPPLASFTARPLSGDAPLAVQFIDTSTPTGQIDSWLWNFGDGQTSSQKDTSHTYNTAGTYAVSLTVSNQAGSNTKTMPNLITVTAPDIIPPNISITEPLDNATVQGAIIIKATASDDREVNRVEFYLDNTLHSADNTPPYEYSWDTKSVSDGLHSIKAKVYDDAGNSKEAVINVRVSNVVPNRPTVLDFIGNQTIDEGQELKFTISATEPDRDVLTYSAGNLPLGASFNQLTRVFSWTPDNSQSGTYSNIHFEVSDGRLTDFEDITITVNDVVIPPPPPPPPVNNPPSAKAGPDQIVESARHAQLDASASFDPDNDPLTYQWTQISGQTVSLQNSNQAIAGFIAPEVTIEQSLEFQLTVTDPDNLSSSDTTTVIVKPKPEVKPAIHITNPQNNSIVAPRSKITIAANVQDSGNLVKNVSFLVNNKTYRARKNRQGAYYYNWTVPYGYSKTYNIKAQARDKQGNIVADDSIVVSSSNAPRISLTNPQNNQIVLPKTSIPVTANLSPSNIGITKVEFYINNQKKHTDRNFPYSYNWRVPKEPNQTYDIQVKAFTRSEDSSRDILVGESETIGVRTE